MMASIEKQLQNLRQRLNLENESTPPFGHNANGSATHSPQTNSAANHIPSRRPPPPPPPQHQTSDPSLSTLPTRTPPTPPTPAYRAPPGWTPAPVQQFPRRQYSLSATQRQSNQNLQLNLSHVTTAPGAAPNSSQSLNAQCLSPRPRPRNLLIGGGLSPGRPGSPSRNVKPIPLNLSQNLQQNPNEENK
ncbi:unnamed protein product, partial [Oppiella nova]